MYKIGKECGGKWFPGIGYGYWDGFHSRMFRINLKPRKIKCGVAIGPLMIWKVA